MAEQLPLAAPGGAHGKGQPAVTVHLDDGSLATVEPLPSPGCSASLVRRWVVGEVVWEQVLSSFPADHTAKVQRVLDAMGARPADFTAYWARPARHLELGAA